MDYQIFTIFNIPFSGQILVITVHAMVIAAMIHAFLASERAWAAIELASEANLKAISALLSERPESASAERVSCNSSQAAAMPSKGGSQAAKATRSLTTSTPSDSSSPQNASRSCIPLS